MSARLSCYFVVEAATKRGLEESTAEAALQSDLSVTLSFESPRCI